MFSTINDNGKVVENIVEKWGFSPPATQVLHIWSLVR
jgi:hypothetical protein